MRVFRQGALVTPFVSVGLVLFGLSSCVVEDKKRNRDDDCDTDSDCDDDEFCDEDGECARRASGSGGTSPGTAGMGGTSVGTAGTVGSAGTSSAGGSANSSADSDWCTDACQTLSNCPDALPLSECVSGCLSDLASVRSVGCGAQYEALIECILTTDFCDAVAQATDCEAEGNALIACGPSAPAG